MLELDIEPPPAILPELTPSPGVTPRHPAPGRPGATPDDPDGDEGRRPGHWTAGLRWRDIVALVAVVLSVEVAFVGLGLLVAMPGLVAEHVLRWLLVTLGLGVVALLPPSVAWALKANDADERLTGAACVDPGHRGPPA